MKWPVFALGDLSEAVEYGHTASAVATPVGPRFLRITDIQDGAVNWHSVPYCECDAARIPRYGLRPGDIVFARTGATTGKSYLIRDCPSQTVFASYLIRVRPSNRVFPPYLARYFETDSYWAQVTKSSTGTAQPGVNASSLKSIKVPLPALEEQRRIAAILGQADALRRNRRESLAKLDTLLQSVFLDMFGDPATNPKGWPEVQLASILTFLTSGSRGWASHYAASGSLFLRIQNVKGGRLILDDVAYVNAPNSAESRRTKVQAGDVLLSITADLGRTGVVPPDIVPAYINQHLAILRLRDAVPEFISAYLESVSGRSQIMRLNRVGVKSGLNFDDVRSLRIKYPPLSLQREFAGRVAKVQSLELQLLESATTLDQLFSSAQERLFGQHEQSACERVVT